MIRTALRRCLALLPLLLLAPAADALVFRAYLSAAGNDANPCTLAQPCRLLPAALGAVAPGGEIWMLDSANYNTGTVVVGKSVSIMAMPGVTGSLVAAASSTPAVSIAASGLTVAFRNVVISALPGTTGTEGISLAGVSTLVVENSLIENIANRGILVSGAGVLRVADSTFRNNGSYGVWVEGGGRAAVVGSRFVDNDGGVIAWSVNPGEVTSASVSDCFIAGGTYGVRSHASANTSTARASVARSTVQGTVYALNASVLPGAGLTSVISVGETTSAHNVNGWYISGTGASIRSYGNNQFSENTTSSGALTQAALQ
jgi:hypothetical protein